jgi:hypothetical protein
MSVTEKAAYLKGLYEGMGLQDEKSKEARMLGAIVEALEEMAEHIQENEDGISVLDDEVFDLSEAVDALRDEDFDEEDEDDYDDDEDDEDEDDEDEDVELELPAEIPCPACGEPLIISAEDLEEGEVTCSHCGKELQVEVELEDEDED